MPLSGAVPAGRNLFQSPLRGLEGNALPCLTAMCRSGVARVRLRPFTGLSLLALLFSGCDSTSSSAPTPRQVSAAFVGSAACQTCHDQEYSLWRESHHALSMQPATPSNVLGQFTDIDVQHFGQTSTVFTRDQKMLVRSPVAGGNAQEFPVRYTFGVFPLQQYLVEAAGGRLQALPIAWDSRSTAAGGQRWFHLYPTEPLAPGDPLHWQGPQQNWNLMCAECHSTNLVKNYQVDSNTFATTWSELNVGCEGCHGPASSHVDEAETQQFSANRGLVANLNDSGRATWRMNPATGIAERSEPRLRPPQQPEACGRCHARRSVISSNYVYGQPLLATHIPALLDEALYFADGQVDEEVFVYGSFLQSKMYQSGVSCSDCHEPHAATLRNAASTSAVCATCHLPSRFASAEHHHHEEQAAACVDCHMASRTFMVVDDRRDHSFRIPRPEMSDAVGAPDACTSCHADRNAAWATAAMTDWYGTPDTSHYAYVLNAGRQQNGNAALLRGIENTAYPGIVRATLLTLLQAPYSQAVATTISTALGDADGLVRLGALRALPGLQPEQQADLASPLLADSLRGVRIEALRVVSPWRNLVHARHSRDFSDAEAEFIDAQLATAERPAAHASLGNLYLDSGDAAQSEAAFRQALRIDALHVGARGNLADLYRRLGRDSDAEDVLRAGLALRPAEPAWQHALGLLLVRTDRQTEGLQALRKASEDAPDNARYLYVYAVALNSLAQSDAAIDLLASSLQRFKGDFDIHWALATMLRDQQRREEAFAITETLLEHFPGIQPAEELLRSLQ